jgi:hypothetical protein
VRDDFLLLNRPDRGLSRRREASGTDAASLAAVEETGPTATIAAGHLTNAEKSIFIHGRSLVMEEMEITSWLTLDAIKKSKSAEVVESVGNLQSGHSVSVFCIIEEDFLELCYSDSAANYLRRYEDRDEFEEALGERKEDVGETPYDEDEERDYDEDEDKDKDEAEFDVEDESEAY